MFKLTYFSRAFSHRIETPTIRKLALCVSLVCAVSALGVAGILGPTAIIDSLSDAGDGKIKIAWSLSEPAENEKYKNDYPDKVCVRWILPEDFSSSSNVQEKCFEEGMSTQADLTIDTGIGSDSQPTEYSVNLVAYYGVSRIYGTEIVWEDVTLNASNS